jgi:ribosomal protein S6
MILMPDHTPTKLKHAITLIRLIKGTVSLEMMDQNLNAVERILEGLAGAVINDTEPSQNRKLAVTELSE